MSTRVIATTSIPAPIRALLATGVLAAALIVLLLTPVAAATPPRLEVGQPFPDLLLPSLETGEPRSIADFRGERIVLHVFASW